jgi:hypothetical protein
MADKKGNMITERLRAKTYEPEFDRRKDLSFNYLSKQIDTFIGERLNVRLSKNRYEMKNGLIYGQDMNEPFIEVMKRGVDYRRKTEGENRADKEREEAEVEGFLKTQELMCDPNTSIGTMMLSVSPQGGRDSSYGHNFYDIFTLKEENGKRFVEARRYSSALKIEEYKDKLSPFAFTENISSDADFLKNPIKIDDVFFENAEQIHSYLHKDHQVTEDKKFKEITQSYRDLKIEYFEKRDPLTLQAIMNKADEKAGLTKNEIDIFINPGKPLTVEQEINYYGRQEVRVVATGCGSSGSLLKNILDNKSSPFSVSEFGLNNENIDYDFDQDGPCKKCNADTKCGPCGICKACDLSIRASSKTGVN